MVLLLSLTGLMAQGQGKGKEKQHTSDKAQGKKIEKKEDDVSVQGQGNGKSGKGNSKTRINIPTQVRNSFQSDYPGAQNAVWTKNRGDWTVTFNGGYFYKSTATYHSNGDRVDTRTKWRKEETPRNVLDSILRRFPKTNPTDIFKIEKPKNPNLFQVILEAAGKKKILVVDENGKLISEQ